MDLIKFKQECADAPRLKEMSNFFSSTASGSTGMPLINQCKADTSLFSQDASVNLFHKVHEEIRIDSNFNKHYFASIPYILEEYCRLGTALVIYGINKSHEQNRNTNIYTLGTTEATLARTIGKLANGAIKTFSDSPTKENKESFFSNGKLQNSKFFVGPFYQVNYDLFESNPEYHDFRNGFDIILEDTTFQMYSKNRYDQILSVKNKLVDDGVFIFIEKFNQKNIKEYIAREWQKDEIFKSKYFSTDQINSKKRSVLNIMDNLEVTLQEFCESVGKIFKHTVITWNSGNFYVVMASNSETSLAELLSNLIPPCIPPTFNYEVLPKKLIGLNGRDVKFRSPKKILNKKIEEVFSK